MEEVFVSDTKGALTKRLLSGFYFSQTFCNTSLFPWLILLSLGELVISAVIQAVILLSQPLEFAP